MQELGPAVLSEVETQRLDELEDVIERGLGTFREVGEALAAIRDSRLYRAEYPTFEEYCQDRWNLSRTRAYELMDAAEVVSAIGGQMELPPPVNERQARELARVPESDRVGVWRETLERTDGKPTAAAVRETYSPPPPVPEPVPVPEPISAPVPADSSPPLTKPAHVIQNNRTPGMGENEWYTPAKYIAAATAVMGAIDLDPASSAVANEVVGAAEFFTAEDDGLAQDWEGRVWLNPPYERGLVDKFCLKLAEEFEAGRVTEAIVLVNNSTDSAWFHQLGQAATAVCFPKYRIRFWHPAGRESNPLQGQAFVYLGSSVSAFAAQFAQHGLVFVAPSSV